ncbi:MAG: hypothetical protein JSR44_11580 [Spirochaetes bacterium]|nr:hypothetical protein [Spirochaetota bacterium]
MLLIRTVLCIAFVAIVNTISAAETVTPQTTPTTAEPQKVVNPPAPAEPSKNITPPEMPNKISTPVAAPQKDNTARTEPHKTETCKCEPSKNAIISTPARYALERTLEVSGSLLFSFASNNYTFSGGSQSSFTQTQFGFAPNISYFFFDHLALGVTGVFSTNYTSSNSLVNVAAYLAPTYVFDLKKDYFPYVTALLGGANLWWNSANYAGLGVGAKVGIKFALFERVMLDLGLQYLYQDYAITGIYSTASTTQTDYNQNGINASVGLSIWF